MQDYEGAMRHALEIIKRDKAWEDAKGSKLLFKFFETLGNSHPQVLAARKRLASLLF
jgi:putative thioredoxin